MIILDLMSLAFIATSTVAAFSSVDNDINLSDLIKSTFGDPLLRTVLQSSIAMPGTGNDDFVHHISSLEEELVSISADDWLPPLYDSVLTLNRDNFPADSRGRLVVDVWDYKQRMSLYKFMVENIDHCAWKEKIPLVPGMKLPNPTNILWGLPLQHGWQFSSNRLFNDGNSTAISPDAWWACMNYYLSVIPYLGAVQAGVAPAIALAYNPDPSLFCDNLDSCPTVMKAWTDFFVFVNESANSCSSSEDILSVSKESPTQSRVTHNFHTPLVDRLDFNMTSDLEAVLKSLWEAHITSIGYGLPLFTKQLSLLSKPEAHFGMSWAGLVDLIADTYFPCNILWTNVLQNLLPPRILTDEDQPPFIEDITRLQNRAVVLIDGIEVMNIATNGLVSKVWKQWMCSQITRSYGREIIALGMYRPIVILEDTKEIYRALRENICQ